jgi:hypothetical protein
VIRTTLWKNRNEKQHTCYVLCCSTGCSKLNLRERNCFFCPFNISEYTVNMALSSPERF